MNKSRVSTSIPNDALYGPADEGGLSLHHLYLTQGFLHLNKFVTFLGSDTITGNLISASLEMCTLEVGIGRSIFSLDYDKFGQLVTNSWVQHIWKFCFKYDITLTDRCSKFPLPSRENDLYLMEAFEAQGYQKKHLLLLNKCRLYLQVLTVSDIMNGKGNGFTRAFLCEKDHQPRNHYKWPFQATPTTSMIKKWKSALKRTFGLHSGITTHTLGAWLHNDISNWLWFHHPSSSSLFQRYDHLWHVWKRDSRRGRIGINTKYKYCTTATRLPPSASKATVKFYSSTRVQFTGSAPMIQDPTTLYSNNLSAFMLPLNIQEERIDYEHLYSCLQQGTLNVVSDGSFLPDHNIGAAGWVIESQDEQVHLEGSFGCVGPEDIQNSCRSELSGILYAMIHLERLSETGNVQQGKVTIHCDGLSAIQAIEKCPPDCSVTKNNFDVINSIIALRRHCKVTFTLAHISGHQDRHMAFHQLTKLEKLNVHADALAKQAARSIQRSRTSHSSTSLPFNPCEIFIKTTTLGSSPICTMLMKSLRQLITKDDLRQYWIQKKDLDNLSIKVDWTLREKSLNNIPKNQQRWLCKHSTGFCGVGTMLKKYKFQQHTRCPRCSKDGETTTHILQCQGEGVQSLWEGEIQKLTEWMETQSLPTEFVKMIRHNLLQYRNPSISAAAPTNVHLHQALLNQNSIGWTNFIEGLWSRQFLIAITQYHTI